MMTLPTGLANFMQGKNLDGLKPFAFLFRNKWVEESGDAGHYELDTTPIDISSHIVKPNTLSMTLDVNEVAQYNANNVTLTLADDRNYFVEGTPNSYFPDGFQLYGSRVVLYYGTDDINRTPLFTGVIKDLPTYKPEQYQVELKLVSPLEMLKDIEAKDFSDKVVGETLTYKSTDSDGHRIYWTTGVGVGGFDAVYADGNKLFEGVDYEVSQTNALGLPAVVTIINSDYYSSTITADYYTWKTGLTVEQIVAGLVALAGYNSTNEDIRNVVWNNQVRGQLPLTSAAFTLCYQSDGSGNYTYTGNAGFSGGMSTTDGSTHRFSQFPTNFRLELIPGPGPFNDEIAYYIGDFNGNALNNGYCITWRYFPQITPQTYIFIYKVDSGVSTQLGSTTTRSNFVIERQNNQITISVGGVSVTGTANFTGTGSFNEQVICLGNFQRQVFTNSTLTDLDSAITLTSAGVCLATKQKVSVNDVWVSLVSEFSTNDITYTAGYRTSNDLTTWSALTPIQLGAEIGSSDEYIQFYLDIPTPSQVTNLLNVATEVLSNTLTLRLVNLTGKSVLESLQDFALISGYEFGVDRQGVFFFRPRLSSTTPTYILGHDDAVKVDTVKKNLSDFFTKLTLTFAQVPLEFYANTGDHPTLLDKYGVINKEIDKPDIVNYDNPELAQAIGPQLLEVYSAFPNIIQVTGKINLALELSDIVSLRRNFNLLEPNDASDFTKWENQQTFYRACKITGMNYNFAKRQITYTLRDVSDYNNSPIEGADMWEFVYDLPIQLGAK